MKRSLMDIHQLRYFVAVAEELHFNRAAQKSHVTQPTLSQSLKKLEGELGTPLLERSPQHVRLTDAGKKFLLRAKAALSELRSGFEELRESDGEISGAIRVGVIPTVCPYLMPEVIVRLKKNAPRLAIDLFEETTSLIVQHLKEGTLDVGILALPIPEKSLISKSLLREPFYLACSRQHPLAAKRSVSRKDIANEQLLILQEGHCFGEQSLEFCRASRKDPNVIFEGSSLTSVMRLAALGYGITLVPAMALKHTSESGIRCVPFSPEKPHREIGAIWRLSAQLTRTHHFFLDTVEGVLTGKKS